jgi:hypothetical protein
MMSQVSPDSALRPKATSQPGAHDRTGRHEAKAAARADGGGTAASHLPGGAPCEGASIRRLAAVQRSGSSQGTISRLTAMTISERGTPTLMKSPNP